MSEWGQEVRAQYWRSLAEQARLALAEETVNEVKDPFDAVIEQIQETNRRKRADYTVGADPWSNFKDVARQINATPGTSVEVLIATKQARLRSLFGEGKAPRNESIEDTLLDRAVYSIIALAMYREGLYSNE